MALGTTSIVAIMQVWVRVVFLLCHKCIFLMIFLGDSDEIRFTIGIRFVGMVIGTGAANKKHIESEFNCRMFIDKQVYEYIATRVYSFMLYYHGEQRRCRRCKGRLTSFKLHILSYL